MEFQFTHKTGMDLFQAVRESSMARGQSPNIKVLDDAYDAANAELDAHRKAEEALYPMAGKMLDLLKSIQEYEDGELCENTRDDLCGLINDADQLIADAKGGAE